MAYGEEAAQRFFEWIRYVDTPDAPDRPPLQDFLYRWLVDGKGVDAVGGKYKYWLTTALHIADAVFRDPSLLEYVGDELEWREAEKYHADHGEPPPSTVRQRPVEGILDLDDNVYSLVFDEQHFDMVVWRRNHPAGPAPNSE